MSDPILQCQLRARRSFEPKHGTAERWDSCDCKDCHCARPYPRNCTLSPEEVADAQADGVEVVGDPGGISYARRNGRWFWTESKTALAAGLYEPKDGVFPVPEKAAAALDRVVDHWARVAEMDKIAAQVAEHIKAARAAAERHVAAFAESIDSLSVEAAEPRRDMVIGLRAYLRDFDRLLRVYERQADGSKP